MDHNFARENELYYLTVVKDGYMLWAYLEKETFRRLFGY